MRAALVLFVLSLPRSAFAFSDPSSFALPAAAAGGGGRFFTGSPADGYTCKVCHSGGPATELRVTGLPDAGYVPTAQYEITLDWPVEVDKFSAAVELTDLDGRPAGSVRLPPLDEMLAPEFCEPASDLVPAASLNDAPNGRQVITVPDCGARQLRFLWTAPSLDVGTVWFAGSSVISDGRGDTAGDGVSDFGRAVRSDATGTVDAALATAGCAVSEPGRREPKRTLCFGLALLCSRWRRRRSRR
ncbi:MAG TPA: hypothetical protein VGI70_01745 [Polyangiales bacterium]|jgi:hypothetical protein